MHSKVVKVPEGWDKMANKEIGKAKPIEKLFGKWDKEQAEHKKKFPGQHLTYRELLTNRKLNKLRAYPLRKKQIRQLIKLGAKPDGQPPDAPFYHLREYFENVSLIEKLEKNADLYRLYLSNSGYQLGCREEVDLKALGKQLEEIAKNPVLRPRVWNFDLDLFEIIDRLMAQYIYDCESPMSWAYHEEIDEVVALKKRVSALRKGEFPPKADKLNYKEEEALLSQEREAVLKALADLMPRMWD